MRLNSKALAVALGIIWMLAFLFVSFLNVTWTGYGSAFLEVVASIYPGVHTGGTLKDIAIGTVYCLADGILGGLIFAWLYNLVLDKIASGQKEI
jgi:hypothetical protein